ncbi:F0F1 ATP synthase subunit gamma [Pelotomaculum isophthalicicum JI]|uniref:ATP synthase gamma chain n=1 Tax=Pelotomaculum isophthalicicum JI TaxID=947010 RepID=A0A9X4H5I1_9FIRM|nr:ATP synthase F1 subunit gamma [Pelotomaculum isophthalicicum]MDF9407634.1 F0F1 ATP synthase subunit gamma [Pelotomaculum isophthalicicum JI]
MASLRDLRRRIKATENMQKITKAMKAVSAAKMRRAQDAVLAARPYSKRIRGVLGRVALASGAVKHPLLAVREPKKVCYVIITADRGLCGGFNGNVIRRVAQEVKGAVAEISMITAGRKGYDFFRKRGYNIDGHFIGLGDEIKYQTAQGISSLVIRKYTEAEYDEVYLVYSQFVNVMVQKPVVMKLLPAEPPAEEGKEGQEGQVQKVNYIFEPEAEAVLAELLPKYLENAVYQGLLESKAGEQCARMSAMDNATKNASEMISKLTLSMNRARQAAITSEISEIVGGAAALE